MRPAFLRGIMVGVAMRKVVDALEVPDLTDEEKRIRARSKRRGLANKSAIGLIHCLFEPKIDENQGPLCVQ